MSTVNEAKEAILTRFIAEWASLTPFNFDNENFKPPVDEAYVSVFIQNRSSDQDTLGKKTTRKFLRKGVVMGIIYTLPDKGTQLSNQLSQKIMDIFEGERLSDDLWFDEVDIRELGTGDKFYMVEYEANFTYEQIK